MVHYVADWILQQNSVALLVGEEERYKYPVSSIRHKLTQQNVTDINIWCDLVELQQKKKCLFYPEQQYFYFIWLVEYIYVNNTTTGLMMTYVDINLIQAISVKIKSLNKVRLIFLASSLPYETTSETDKFRIMDYILDRYIKMSGCWFVKHTKTSQDKTIAEMKVATQPTHVKVTNQHAHSTSIAKEVAL